MGQRLSEIPKGSFSLHNKISKTGEQAIYLKYYVSSQYIWRSTDIWVPIKDWDQKRQCVRAANPNGTRINRRINDLKARADNALLAYDQGALTPEIVKSLLDGAKPSEVAAAQKSVKPKTDFIQFAKEVNGIKYGKKKYGYTAWYNKNKYIEAFERYVRHDHPDKYPLYIEDLNVKLFDQYIAYRFDHLQNTSKEGVNKTLVPLYSALKYAVDNGVADIKNISPILENYVAVKETEYNPQSQQDETVRYLTPEQLAQLMEYKEKSKSQTEIDVLDMFFFAFYVCGLRLSDIMTLEWENVDFEEKVVKKVQFKTKKQPDIYPPLCDEAKEILENWKGRNKRFVFDLIPSKYEIANQKQLFMDRNSRDKRLNRTLSIIQRELNFPFPLTMHVARHTFAVMAINNGVSIYMLSKLLGHSSILATEKTYAQFIKEKVDDDFLKIIKATHQWRPRRQSSAEQPESAS